MGLQPATNWVDLHLIFTGSGGESVGLLGMQRCELLISTAMMFVT